MRLRPGSAAALTSLLALAFLPFASCGSGDPVDAGFGGTVVGAQGGSVLVDTVQLVVPPGAFAEDTVVVILPQPDPLPLDDESISYHSGIHCIGPVGLCLQVPAYVRVCYDPSGLPKGADEEDLVLLEWNDKAQAMFESLDAVQDLENHCFEDFVYGCLGHVAIGVRVGGKEPPPPQFEFVFHGGPAQPPALVGPQGVSAPNAIHLQDLDGALPLLPMDGTADARDYLASRDGSRVLFQVFDDETESSFLHSVDVANVGPLANRQLLDGDDYSGSDPLFGWLGDQDLVFHEHFAPTVLGGQGFNKAFSTVPGGGGSVTDVQLKPSYMYLDDVRVSPGRTMVMLQWIEFSKGIFTYVDVLDATTGAPIGLDLPVETEPFGNRTPRWLPPDETGESPGLYFVEDDGVTVTRIDPDGTNAATLYTLTVLNSYLEDFVVRSHIGTENPGCAFVRHDFGLQTDGSVTIGPDVYATDDLAGGAYAQYDLGGDFGVVEMVPVHGPNFESRFVLLQLQSPFAFEQGGPPFPGPPDGTTLVFGDGTNGTTLHAVIPTPVSYVDVSNDPDFPGQVLAWVEFVPASAADPLDYPVPGVYHLDAQFQAPTLVTPAGTAVYGPPRWLESWRFAPGHYPFSPRVR
jgi:hypothetical protein